MPSRLASLHALFFLMLLCKATVAISETQLDQLTALKNAAINGDLNAQSQLASMYYLGEGVEQSHSQAFAWYQLAAEQGDINAQYSLGNLYLLGEGVKADQQLAVLWYQQAAAQGHPRAQYRLDRLLADASTIDTQPNAEQEENRYAGAPLTEQQLTDTNQQAPAVETDFQETVNKANNADLFQQLFGDNLNPESSAVELQDNSRQLPEATEPTVVRSTSSDSDDKTSTDTSITSSLQPGPIVEQDSEQDTVYQEITKQNPQLYGLYQQAEQGDDDAQYRLANAFYQGREVKQNFEQAFLWFRRAAEHGNANAQYSLGNIYLMGEGVEQSDDEALYWYQQAAEQNHQQAKHNFESLQSMTNDSTQATTVLTGAQDDVSSNQPPSSSAESYYQQGMQYSIGDGVERDYQKAFAAFQQAADEDHARAQYQLAIAYAFGEGVKKDLKQAFQWFYRSAISGELLAQRQLASMFWSGNGTEQDKIQSAAWYQIVARQGNDMDIKRLQEIQSALTAEQNTEAVTLAASLSEQVANP